MIGRRIGRAKKAEFASAEPGRRQAIDRSLKVGLVAKDTNRLTDVVGIYNGRVRQRWLGSSEQLDAIAKWSVRRFHAAARSGRLK